MGLVSYVRGELCLLWLFCWFAWSPCLWAIFVVLLLRSRICINLELLSTLVACARRVPGVLVRFRLVGLIVGLYIGSGVWFAFPLPGMWARFYLVVAC